MADYVLLEGGRFNDRIRVVVHTAVPNTFNAVGFNWRTAVAEDVGDTQSRVPVSILPGGRQVLLDTGELYEWEFNHADDANLSAAARLTNLESAVSGRESEELVRLQNRLNYYGKTGNV